jgi:FAD/FMN-containing dehydrogenase
MIQRIHGAAVPALQELRRSVRGGVIEPGDPDGGTASRGCFRGVDRSPAAVVRPVDSADVARLVRGASDAGAELTVRSGSHSLAASGVVDGADACPARRSGRGSSAVPSRSGLRRR